MDIYSVHTSQDLAELAEERGIELDWEQPVWVLVDDVICEHECRRVRPGPDEEILRLSARLAVRNVDPEYRGYTPWGDISA